MAADTAVMSQLTHHLEEVRETAAASDALFVRLDDPASLASHMTGSFWMMGGGGIEYLLDEQCGKAIGSRITMIGSAFGLNLRVDEVVVEHEPPRRKRWRTVGAPQLLIIGGYEMGFEIEPLPSGSRLRVWIDYGLPGSRASTPAGAWTGWSGMPPAPFLSRRARRAQHEYRGGFETDRRLGADDPPL
jgi:hypothetical protein